MYWKIVGRVGWVVIAIGIFLVGQKTAYVGVEKRLHDIEVDISRSADIQYTLMDLTLRSYHYAKPHKNPVAQCPECYDLIHRLKNHERVVTESSDLK